MLLRSGRPGAASAKPGPGRRFKFLLHRLYPKTGDHRPA
ncbi:hypothetical protein F8B43_4244 [Methylorubrum populi]|uniref:Uncharacterized protein n=1 Tax=Methylorubrum populi TaxID=223967 RepID=A0A833J1R5_9HYPH|nr:hypothetical protein F8B43_4244 [Methylorubrum populi]